MNPWIKAFRLRTLPLALSGIFVGGALAAKDQAFSWDVFVVSLLTALLLQVLSNLANDYGDFVKGTDNAQRVGPERALQSGAITPKAMKRAMWITGGLSFASGLTLIGFSLRHITVTEALVFLGLGGAALWAAVSYTVGEKAYGYRGLGDVFVFLFFGIVAVGGSYFLHSGMWNWTVLLPASALGLFSAGVLNMNNMRDVTNDSEMGKITLPVRLGKTNAKRYHSFLILGGISCVAAFLMSIPYTFASLLLLIPLLVFVLHLITVIKIQDEKAYDKQLKVVVLGTLSYAILFSVILTQ